MYAYLRSQAFPTKYTLMVLGMFQKNYHCRYKYSGEGVGPITYVHVFK